jgi:peroxiredoxin
MMMIQRLVLGGLLAMVSLGLAAAPKVNAPAPDFKLPGSDGQSHQLNDYRGKYVVLEWWNKDCPFVRKHYGSGNMQQLQKSWRDKGVVWFTVLSSAPGKQGHLPKAGIEKVMTRAKASPTTVLMDEKGTVGRLYGAKTTPHMYVINPKGQLIYKGAIDDKPTTDQADIKGAQNYVQQALTQAMNEQKVKISSTRPYGCSVKY